MEKGAASVAMKKATGSSGVKPAAAPAPAAAAAPSPTPNAATADKQLSRAEERAMAVERMRVLAENLEAAKAKAASDEGLRPEAAAAAEGAAREKKPDCADGAGKKGADQAKPKHGGGAAELSETEEFEKAKIGRQVVGDGLAVFKGRVGDGKALAGGR